jgi:hypothetical protein
MDGLEQDAPATRRCGGSFAGRNVEQNVPRTDWDCNSQPHEEDVFSSSVSFRRKGGLLVANGSVLW